MRGSVVPPAPPPAPAPVDPAELDRLARLRRRIAAQRTGAASLRIDEPSALQADLGGLRIPE